MCEVCQAMRDGRESYEAQLPCGHCPTCCTCDLLVQVEGALREAWREGMAQSLERTRGWFDEAQA